MYNRPRLRLKESLTDVSFDLLASALLTGVFFLLRVYTIGWADLRTLFFGTGMMFVWAGFLRGNSAPANSGLKALLHVSVLVIVFALILPISRLLLQFLTVVAFGSSLASIYARRSWAVSARKRSVFILLATLGLVGIASAIGAPILAERLTTRTGNVPAPQFSVMRLNGQIVDSSQLKGRVAVLDFWATWCPPCWKQFPVLQGLFERYQSNPGVVFIAVDGKGHGETPDKARAFGQREGYTIPLAFDEKGAAAKLHIGAYPFVVVLDKSGNVRLVRAGYDGSEHFLENMSKEIDRLLAE